MMNLDEMQRKKVAVWIADGLKLSEIQSRLASEFGFRLTYMDVRLLVDDLKLVPIDPEPPKSTQSVGAQTQIGTPAQAVATKPVEPLQPANGVSVTVDELTRPGAVVSGKVTFSDGQQASWYLDQMGRLGLAPKQQGYKPSAADVQQFQIALEKEMTKLGY